MNGALAAAANALWVLGLSTLLACVSWAHWEADRSGAGFRAELACTRAP